MTIFTSLGKPFINSSMAVLAASSVQMLFTFRRYLTSTYFDLDTRSLSVTVHHKLEDDMTLPIGYLATSKEYHEFTSERDGHLIVTTTFYFGYEE